MRWSGAQKPSIMFHDMSFGENELRVVGLLEARPQLDLFQIASATRMAPEATLQALERLRAHGLVRVNDQKSSTWYSLDERALHDQLAQPAAVA